MGPVLSEWRVRSLSSTQPLFTFLQTLSQYLCRILECHRIQFGRQWTVWYDSRNSLLQNSTRLLTLPCGPLIQTQRRTIRKYFPTYFSSVRKNLLNWDTKHSQQSCWIILPFLSFHIHSLRAQYGDSAAGQKLNSRKAQKFLPWEGLYLVGERERIYKQNNKEENNCKCEKSVQKCKSQ